MRLIDADELKDWSEIVPLTGDGGIDINDFDEKLKSMPTVDAVPVIRCKDCVYCRDTTDGTRKYCTSTGSLVNDGDFCSWSERKEE